MMATFKPPEIGSDFENGVHKFCKINVSKGSRTREPRLSGRIRDILIRGKNSVPDQPTFA